MPLSRRRAAYIPLPLLLLPPFLSGAYNSATGASSSAACIDCGAGKLPHPPGSAGGQDCARLDIGICSFVPPSTMAALSSLCVCVHIGISLPINSCCVGGACFLIHIGFVPPSTMAAPSLCMCSRWHFGFSLSLSRRAVPVLCVHDALIDRNLRLTIA
jgi:hypothetical protein